MTLLAAYGFGAGSGSTIADDSGNGHTLTLGSASWTASGHTGPGITNTAANSTGASTSTMPVVTGSNCTLMCWVKPLDLTAGTTHFVCGSIETNGNTDFAIFTQRGEFGAPNVVQGDVRVGGLVAVNGTAALTVGTWAHVALTFDGTNMRLYVNGSLMTTVANAGTLNNAANFYIAGANPTAALDTDVVVDDVRYYNEALDATAITAAMNTPVGSSPTDLALLDPVAGSTRLGTASTSLATGVILLDVITPARLGSTSTTAAIGKTFQDLAGYIRAASTFGELVGAATVLADPGAGSVRLGSTATGVTSGSASSAFLCQDFAGTVALDSYGGVTVVESYSGTVKVVSYGGTVHVESFGGTTTNCGR
jgi:hypothetical protein